MSDSEVIRQAKNILKPLLAVNIVVLVFIIMAFTVFSSPDSAIYFGIFYLIEFFMFLIIFFPVFVYSLAKRRGIKYSLAKGMLAFGDFYHYIVPW